MAYRKIPGGSVHGNEVSVYCPECKTEYHVNIFEMCRQKRLEPCPDCKDKNGIQSNNMQMSSVQ